MLAITRAIPTSILTPSLTATFTLGGVKWRVRRWGDRGIRSSCPRLHAVGGVVGTSSLRRSPSKAGALAPDLVGYDGSDAPSDPEAYSTKRWLMA